MSEIDTLPSDGVALPPMELRQAARLAAVQALYQMDLTQMPSKSVVFEFQNHRFGHEDEPGYTQADERFFEALVSGVVAYQKDIDPQISERLSEKWKLSRLDKTLRAILRCGAFELLHKPEVPAATVIDQYVGISAQFYDERESGFVNAVLDKLSKSVRPVELMPTNSK